MKEIYNDGTFWYYVYPENDVYLCLFIPAYIELEVVMMIIEGIVKGEK